MNDLFGVLKSHVDNLVIRAKAAAADGKISLAEAWELTQAVLLLAYSTANSFNLSGVDKKAAVMALMGYLFDVVFPMLDLTPVAYPLYILSWVLPKGWERKAFLFLVDRAIEGVHKFFKQLTPATPPAPAPAK
jgi:hypothetical protein